MLKGHFMRAVRSVTLLFTDLRPREGTRASMYLCVPTRRPQGVKNYLQNVKSCPWNSPKEDDSLTAMVYATNPKCTNAVIIVLRC